MQIDGFTFTAQVLNFLVLVFLLRRFLYEPILNAMAAREQTIHEQLQQAELREEQADQARRELEGKAAELDRTRTEQLATVRTEVDTWRQEELRQAREEIEQSRAQWQKGLRMEQQRFLRELRERAVLQVHEIAQRALSSLANASLEEQIVEQFRMRLQQLPASDRQVLCDCLISSGGRLRVRSAFELQADTVESVRQAIETLETALPELDVQTQVDSSIVCGLEIQVGDHKFPWHVAGYLESLEHSFAAAMEHYSVTA